MRFFHTPRRPSPARMSADSARQQRTAWQNLILCVVGLIIGFFYLLQRNSMGWFFLLGFSLFLILQATPREHDN